MSSTNTSWSNESNTKADSTIASTVSNVNIPATSKLYLDGGGNTYLTETSADLIDIYAGAAQVLTIASSVLTVNEGGSATVDFRIESDGEDEALFMDASANTLYINKGETAFTTSIHSTNDVAMTIGSAGVVFNEDGHATNDFRVESNGNANMLFVDGGNNKVGIGTSSPDYLLDVEASGDSTVRIYSTSGSADAVLRLENATAAAWQIYVDGNDDDKLKIRDVTGTATLMTFDDANGNVGVGLTAPTAKLHVTHGTSGEWAGQFVQSHAGGYGVLIDVEDADIDPAFKITSGSTVCLNVDGNGKVGIGTASPDATLHIVSSAEGGVADGNTNVAQLLVESTGSTAGSTGPTLALLNSSVAVDNDIIGAVAFLGDDDVGDATGDTSVSTTYGRIYCQILDMTEASSATTDGKLFFQTPVNDTLTTHMTMSGGNVGIGTAAPASNLHIAHASGSVITLSGGTPASAIAISDGTALGKIDFTGYDSTGSNLQPGTGCRIIGEAADAWGNAADDVDDTGAELQFWTCDNDAANSITKRMVIGHTGNVGIGVAAPTYPLVVNGTGTDGYVALFDNSGSSSTSHGIRIQAGDADHSDDSDTHYISFEEHDGTGVGELDSDSGNLALSDTSDYRLKENVNLITGGLAKVNALKPSTFNYKKYPNKVHEGFIAHEVQEAGVGYAVKGEKDAMKTKVTLAVEAVDAVLDEDGNIIEEAIEAVVGKTEQVDSNQLLAITNLIPQMVSAIQELSAKVTALENA